MEIKDPGTFRTSNEDIAIGLLTAGCRWAAPEEGGPAQTHYTPELLRDRGHLGPAQVDMADFERKSVSLFERHIPGATSFFLHRSEDLNAFLDAWEKADGEFRQAAVDGREPVTADIDPRTIARVLHAFCRNKRDNKKAPFLRPPRFSIRRGVQTRPGPGGTQVTSGSMKSWYLGIPEDKRAEMGLHSTPPELRKYQSSPASK